MAKTTKPVKKRDNFIDLAYPRANAVLKGLKILSNCSNKRHYEWKEEEIEEIFTKIQKQVVRVRAMFEQAPEITINVKK
ncbi:MAG: hypothetical protein HQL21_07130 [Candidatus Omnitrophica bacterium]|nr:hypothetical protein [Candidatus Omnitrophota bacterium]